MDEGTEKFKMERALEIAQEIWEKSEKLTPFTAEAVAITGVALYMKNR